MSDNAGEPARIVSSSILGKVEIIGPPECPILARRTIVSTRIVKLLSHEFFPGASDKDPHDHPRSFLTIVWRGGYDDVSPCPWCLGSKELRIPGGSGYDEDGTRVPPVWRSIRCPECRRRGEATGELVDRVRAPAIRYRPATHAHITRVHADGARSIVVMGPLVRAWGFLRDGRWWPWGDYEREFGVGFRCDD